MGKVWLEDIIPETWMAEKLDDPKRLTEEDVLIAKDTTRVPPVIYDPSLMESASAYFSKNRIENQRKTAHYTLLDHLGRILPVVNWLRTYQWRAWFLNDLFAGIAVALMGFPEGMSYAQNLAFLPQVYGLYGAFVPTLIYTLLGSSRHLAVGPVAVTSLLLGSGLSRIYGDFSINPSFPLDAYQASLQERYNRGAIQISFIAGAFYTAVALLRLGWIINYLSQPVISGFMTGAASIIVATQVKYLTGQYDLPRSDTVYHALYYMFNNMNLFRTPEFGMGFSLVLILLFCLILGSRYQRLRPLRYLGPIIVTILSLIIENAGQLYVVDFNNPATPIIKDVGPVPRGPPHFTATWWLPLYNVSEQLVLAAIICILDIAESTTIARRVAQQNRYKLDFTQELRALGFTNVFGAMFNCYTTTGSFTRTSVAVIAGGKTLMTSFITGIVIMIILLALTPIFTHLSVNCQGAIVIVAVLPLFDFKNGWFYWKVNKLDFLTWLTAYVVTAMGGALIGLATSVGLSMVVFLLTQGFPRIVSPGPLPNGSEYTDPEVYHDASLGQEDGIVVVRPEAPMFFGNLFIIQDYIEKQIAARRHNGDSVYAIVLDMEQVSDFDGSAAYTFDHYVDELADEQVTLIFANPNKRLILAFQRSNMIMKIRPENVQLTMAEAMSRARVVVDAAKYRKFDAGDGTNGSSHSSDQVTTKEGYAAVKMA